MQCIPFLKKVQARWRRYFPDWWSIDLYIVIDLKAKRMVHCTLLAMSMNTHTHTLTHNAECLVDGSSGNCVAQREDITFMKLGGKSLKFHIEKNDVCAWFTDSWWRTIAFSTAISPPNTTPPHPTLHHTGWLLYWDLPEDPSCYSEEKHRELLCSKCLIKPLPFSFSLIVCFLSERKVMWKKTGLTLNVRHFLWYLCQHPDNNQ